MKTSGLLHAAGTLVLFFGIGVIHAADPTNGSREKLADREVAAILPRMTLEEKVLQTFSHAPNGVPRLGIPDLTSGEVLHGVVSSGATCFPQSIAMAATFDPELMEEVATVIAREARAVGIAQGFAPMLAVSRDPRWGRVEESFGEDPWLVSRMGVAHINGLQGTGTNRFGPDRIIATPKHFVADGEPFAGANGEGFETSERNLRENHLPPFEAAVKEAGTLSIMPAHHAINGVPCHVNTWTLGTILRDEWGFRGFVTSDMSDIPKTGPGKGYDGYAIVPDVDSAVIASIKAGVDQELVGHLNASLVGAVRSGKISEEVIDRAASRVLRAKYLLFGPFDAGKVKEGKVEAAGTSVPDGTSEAIRNYRGIDDVWAKLISEGKFDTAESARRSGWKEILEDPASDALALKAAQKAIILLKNEKGLLPLDRTKPLSLLVVGPVAALRNIGGYSTGQPKFFVTALEGIRKAVEGTPIIVDYAQGCPQLPGSTASKGKSGKEDPEEKLLAEAVAKARKADVIIAVVGHTREQLGENLDRDTLDLPGRQEELVESMHSTGKPVVVVLNSGAPLSVRWIARKVPSILQAFYLGQSSGTAISQALFGGINPGGKLPVSFPRNVGQSPWYYNHPPLTAPINYLGEENDPAKRGGPLWTFGHGLSYTTFRYSDLTVSPASFAKGETATVSATITNTGEREGDEVVQLYLRQDFTSLVRPVRELKGFRRITLKPGESRTVTFPVGYEQIKFWKDGVWVAEPGKIRVMIGSSSLDLRLEGTLEYRGESVTLSKPR